MSLKVKIIKLVSNSLSNQMELTEKLHDETGNPKSEILKEIRSVLKSGFIEINIKNKRYEVTCQGEDWLTSQGLSQEPIKKEEPIRPASIKKTQKKKAKPNIFRPSIYKDLVKEELIIWAKHMGTEIGIAHPTNNEILTSALKFAVNQIRDEAV